MYIGNLPYNKASTIILKLLEDFMIKDEERKEDKKMVDEIEMREETNIDLKSSYKIDDEYEKKMEEFNCEDQEEEKEEIFLNQCGF